MATVIDKIKIELIQDKNYSRTALNAVGQTNSSGLRTINFSSGVYCSESGSDTTGSGTLLSPYRTIGHCNDNLGVNDEIGITSSSYFDEVIDLSSGVTLLASTSGITPRMYSVESAIPDIRLESVGSGITFVGFEEYDSNFYVLAQDGSGNNDLIYTSPDGDTYTQRLDNSDTDFICSCVAEASNIEGVYYGGSGVTKFTSPTNNTSVSGTFGTVRGLTEFNGYVYAVTENSGNYLYRTNDGSNFSVVTNAFSNLTLGTEQVRAIGVFGSYLVVAFDKIIAWSTDGETFTDTNSYTFTAGDVALKKLYEFQDALFIACGAGGLYRTTQLTNTPLQMLSGNIEQIIDNNNLYVVTTSGTLYRSQDGVNYAQLKSSLGIYLGAFKGLIYIANQRYNSYFFKCNDDIEFNNIYFETNYLDYAIYANGQNITCKWCTFTGFDNYAIHNASNLTFYNSKLFSCLNGLESTGNLDIQESVFYKVDNYAVNHSGSVLICVHNTFYSCGYFLYLTGTITSQNVKDCIFSFAYDYAIYSSTTISASYCLYSRGLLSSGVFISSYNYSPVFVKTLANNEDLNIKTRAGGFELPTSIAQGNASDSKDIGAYDYSYTETAKSDIEIELESTPIDFTIKDAKTDFLSSQAISGNPYITFEKVLRSFTFSFGDDRNVEKNFNYDIDFLFSIHSTFWMKPASVTGYDDNTGTGTIKTVDISNYPKAMLYLDIKKDDYQVTVLEDTAKNWRAGKWRGWSVEFGGEYYRVIYSDANVLILDGSPTGTGNYDIDRIRCRFAGSSKSKSSWGYDAFKAERPLNNLSYTFVEVIE